MKSEIHIINTPKTSLIVTSGNQNASKIFLILHGYGQHAQEFLNHFSVFDQSEYFFVLPEALNRFYLKSGKGDTGASWMTKYYREYDIQDNIAYLNQVYDKYVLPIMNSKKQLYVLGFSQGAATLVRWLAANNIDTNKVILWGAVFPPDMCEDIYLKKLKQLKWLYFVGTEDEYISNEDKQQQKDFFHKNQFDLQWIEYNGQHQIDANILKAYL
ncbi:MAG: hypothetical protein N2203_01745 [Bacteroidia bacterium]|nr:hypothetical protein [Bacteroidia bacterium]